MEKKNTSLIYYSFKKIVEENKKGPASACKAAKVKRKAKS